MAIRISDVRVPIDLPEEGFLDRILTIIGAGREEVDAFAVVRRGLDARTKGRVVRIFAADLSLRTPGAEAQALSRLRNAKVIELLPDPWPTRKAPPPCDPVVVVGAGPAGLFAAWGLSRCGVPVILLERGKTVDERAADVERFWADGTLDPESNPQFGEGGAGTFSDGKLTTRIGDPLVDTVVRLFGEMSGLPELCREAKPHVGTDRLRDFCRAMRGTLVGQGVRIRFGARVDRLTIRDGLVKGVVLASGEAIPASAVVLAIGHSARDTVRALDATGVSMTAKPFAVGYRIEHPQLLIDALQYGEMSGHPLLPPADYRFAVKGRSGRGVYTFCMCPGGEVMAASSSSGELAINGMSSNARASGYANSGLVASIGPADFGADGALAGIDFQERIERAAFARGGGGFVVPAQNAVAYTKRSGSFPGPKSGRMLAHGSTSADLFGILPAPVEEDIRTGLIAMGKTAPGFLTVEATLYAVESRTSSPVRFARRDDLSSVSHPGLYPVGEGAGHAGGIVSSAVDGLKAALSIASGLA